ncbi:MAG: DinB family protein [Dehalococcoidia bacterium]
MNGSYLHRLVDYNNWANRGLIEFLAGQPATVLGLTAAGVYGSIGQTFEHLFLSEISYHRKLLKLPKGPDFPTPESPTIASLQALAEDSAQKLAGLVEGLPEATEMLRLDDGARGAATLFTQLVMHGVEHRAHIGTILGANGIVGLELDSWAHGIFKYGDAWPDGWGAEPAARAEFPSINQR